MWDEFLSRIVPYCCLEQILISFFGQIQDSPPLLLPPHTHTIIVIILGALLIHSHITIWRAFGRQTHSHFSRAQVSFTPFPIRCCRKPVRYWFVQCASTAQERGTRHCYCCERDNTRARATTAAQWESTVVIVVKLKHESARELREPHKWECAVVEREGEQAHLCYLRILMYVYLLRSAARTTFEPSELVLSVASGAVQVVCKGGGNVKIIVDCCAVFLRKLRTFFLI